MKRLLPFILLTAVVALPGCEKESGGDPPAGPVKVTGITLNQTTATLTPEGTLQLSVTEVLPANAADKTVTWSTSNDEAATVSTNGLVTIATDAADAATATITATANDGSNKTATCLVTVAFVKVTGITLNQTTATMSPEGTLQLSVTEVLPANAADKTVTWSTSNDEAATVSTNGLVTIPAGAADAATATITATANDGSNKTATCLVTVAFVKVTGITLNQTTATLTPEGTLQLSVTEVLPADAADKTVTWSSDPTSVATVGNDGLVTVAAGAANGATATITATANDGSGKTASCVITVVVLAEGELINGIVWAKANAAVAKSFAATPESTGAFFQWNRNKAWPAAGTVIDWDDTTPTGDSWEAANDPCPAGWRVPTQDEQATLLETANVTSEWTILNAVNGRKFTDKTSGKSIFYPATGYRSFNGTLVQEGVGGLYWLSAMDTADFAWSFDISSSGQYYNYRFYGFPVRCIQQ